MRGQISLETILVFAVILLLFVIVLVQNSHIANSAELVEQKFEEQTECLKLAYLISEVYSQGKGTEIELEISKNAIVHAAQKVVEVASQQCGFLAIAEDASLSGTVAIRNVGGKVVFS